MDNNANIIDSKILNSPIEHKARVFISSLCGDKYTKIRNKLKKALVDSGLFDVYCFEGECGSSKYVKTSYLEYAKNCDILVALIDNHDYITDAVRQEIEVADANNKKIIYVFCNERSKTPTPIQEDLIAKGKQRYSEIDCFENFAKEAYVSIMQDLVSYTIFYDDSKQLDNQSINYYANDDYSNSKIINNTYICNTLLSYFFNDVSLDAKNVEKIELYLCEHLEYILAKKSFNQSNFDNLTNEILKLHRGNVKKVVEQRLRIQNLYYKQEYEKCLIELKDLLDKTIKSSIPKWLYLDIAVDIRYIQGIINLRKNVYQPDNIGQKYIDESNSYIYYPYVDRKVKESNEQILKRYYKNIYESPYQTSFENLEYSFLPLIDSFVAAQIYGSIVQTNLIRQRLIDFYGCLVYTSHKSIFNKEYIRLLLIEADVDKLKKTIRTYTNASYILGNKEIDDILKSIDNMVDEKQMLMSKLETLGFFGYYMDDKTFNKYSKELNAQIMAWSYEKKPMYSMWTHIYNYVKGCNYRLKDKTLVDISLSMLESKRLLTFYRDYFNSLSFVDYHKVSKKQQARILSILESVICNEYIKDIDINSVWNFVVVFCKTATINTEILENLVKNKYPNFYKDTLMIELIDKYNDNPNKYLRKLIIDVNKLADKFVDGIYIEYANDDILTIYKILYYYDIKMSDKLAKSIIDMCFNILSANITANKKIEVIQIIVLMIYKYSKNIKKNRIMENLYINRDIYTLCYDTSPFEKDEKKHIVLALDLINSIYDGSNIFKTLDNLYSNLNTESYDIIRSLEIINTFLKDTVISIKNKELVVQILFYVISKTNHKERDCKFNASNCLIELAKYNYISAEATMHLSRMMQDCPPEVKVSIISRISKLKYNEKYVDEILSKGFLDKNYFVRFAAQNQRGNL